MNLYKIKKKLRPYQRIRPKHPWQDKLYIHLSACIAIAIMLVFMLNQKFFHYHGNNFLSASTPIMLSFVAYAYACCYFFDNLKPYRRHADDYAAIVMTFILVSLATNACQLTPFSAIDKTLAQYEALPLEKTVSWIRQHPYIEDMCILIYNSLNPMIGYCCLGFLFMGCRRITHEFCRYILLTVSIGYCIYYFFPSCGPANAFSADIFLKIQHANHLKFNEIHQGLSPTTNLGGLIALPSYHVLWAWGCARCFYPFGKYFYAAVLWFVLICLSCFVLGWHYSSDILLSFIIILMSEYLLKEIS